jgi:signal peptidase I
VVALGYPTNLSFSIRDHVLEAYKISSTSMAPDILPGDRIFLNKAIYNFEAPLPGDVVVFIYPDDRRLMYIKRIAALPGDTIEIRNNVVIVNGRPLENHELGSSPVLNFSLEKGLRVVSEVNGNRRYPVIIDSGTPQNMPHFTVPHGHCFVLGDNRSQSKDSRTFGAVPLADIKGRVDYIYWPAQSWSRFGRYN